MNKRIRKKQLKKINAYAPYEDTWSLDITIAKFILPRLRLFKEVCDCYPDRDLYSYEEWVAVLDRMIQAFDLISKKFDMKNSVSKSAKDTRVINEGLDLFRKYYHDLWW